MPSIVHEVLRSPGRPLDAATRAFMEPRFGHDFSAVRVHTDEPAARAADAINASAFTFGTSMWFGRGMYQPQTEFGRRLLAHELTHTIQQRSRSSTEGSLRIGGVTDAAEVAADRAAEAVQSGDSMPHIGISGPVILRAPKVSPVPGEPSRRIVDLDDGTRYRVKRTVELQQETKPLPGEKSGPSLTPKIDKNNVWLQVNWCSTGKNRDIHGEVKVGADLPAEAQTVLTDIGKDIKSGTDPREAIRKAEIKPFASVHIAQSERFSVDVSGGPTIKPFDGGVTGGAGKLSLKIAGVEMSAELQVNEPATGSGRRDVRVIGGVTIPLGGPEKVTCQRTFVAPKISYQCEKIVREHEEPKRFPVTRKQTHYFYFEYAKPEFARRGRTAALDSQDKAALKQALDEGYRIDTIRGYASPEGPVARPNKRFEGNLELSRERAKAAEDWVKKTCTTPSVLSMRPSCFAEDYARGGEGELYGTGSEGKELVGKELAEESVAAFEKEKEEEPRRTPDVMKELEMRKTPVRQTDTVWPLLRRAEIVASKPDVETRLVKVPESSEAIACPADVISAATDDFDREKK